MHSGGSGGFNLEGFSCVNGRTQFGPIIDAQPTYVLCNESTGACVPIGERCPGADAGRDADVPDAPPPLDAGQDARAAHASGDAGRDARAPDAH